MGFTMMIFLPENKKIDLKIGKSIYEIAIDNNIDIGSLCGGRGVCGKCLVIVKSGREYLNEPTDSEKKYLSVQDLGYGYRLACQAKILQPGPIVVEVPLLGRSGRYKLQVEGLEVPLELNPVITKVEIDIPPPTLEKQIPDFNSLQIELANKGIEIRSIELEYLRVLPRILREYNWKISVVIYDDTIIHIGGSRPRILGFAIDLGTTKLAGYLVDLETGRVLAKNSMLNPQIGYGADIMSRISHIMKDPRNLVLLRGVLLKAVNEMIERVCEEAGVSPSEIYEVVAVGNTFMHHIFLGIDPRYIALTPYTPSIKKSLVYKSEEVGLKIARKGRVYTPPIIAGFIGSDVVADIIATKLYEMKKPSLLIDIGTNTEIIVNNGENLYAASTASGPAFEGVHIQHGMRAMTGAIEKVLININNGVCDVMLRVIEDVPPVGICGSGIIDAVAEMLKIGVLDRSGRLSEDPQHPCANRIKYRNNVKEFILADASISGTGQDIVITQRDIREIQLAKAAIATGIKLLLREAGLRASDIETLYIAGAFGTYIDATSAMRIGMLPIIPLNKIRYVGNAAGTGARMLLLSKKLREIAELISNSVKYVELASLPDFQKTFIESIPLSKYDI